MKDYYEILGISRNASSEEIKKAFHKLAHKYHPHKGGDEKKFKEINEAYQEKRSQYDRFGRVFDGAPDSGASPDFDFNWFWGKNPEGSGVEFDFEDIGDMFGDFFGFGKTAKKKDSKRGKDIRVDIEIPLEEVIEGKNREISLRKFVVCSRCQGNGAEPGTSLNQCFSCRGTGQVQEIKRTILGSFTKWSVCPECQGEGQKPKTPCNVCKGEGRLKDDEKINIFFPAGVDSNQIIKVAGKGETGRRGGKAGDLYVRIFVKKHLVFERKGDDLYLTAVISFSQAALGGEIEAPTLEGKKIVLKIPAGSESGMVLRISGKGVPHFSGYGRGNLYVQFLVKTPKKLTKKQKELLEKLKEEGL